jgi:hypothetical protein
MGLAPPADQTKWLNRAPRRRALHRAPPANTTFTWVSKRPISVSSKLYYNFSGIYGECKRETSRQPMSPTTLVKRCSARGNEPPVSNHI